jgi:carboxylate-amine ligase
MHDPHRSVCPRFGIEEEYFLVDAHTYDMPPAPPEGFFAACRDEFGELLSAEMFKSQIELVTPILRTLEEAKTHVEAGRRRLNEVAKGFDLAVICVGAHPFADWRAQQSCEEGSYPELFADHQMVAQRSLLSGLHVHVEIPAGHDRIRVMNRVLPWLPLLLALSSSSPFWGARNTGLKSYRQALCGEWPRMGMPEYFPDEAAFHAYAHKLVSAGAIRKANDVWWTIRPSARYPTLELRIADACPLVDDALCIVGLFRALIAHALAHADDDTDGRDQRLLTAENYWRARRFGVHGQFLDREGTALGRLDRWLDQAQAQLGEGFADPWVLAHARHIVQHGSSADRQLAFYHQALGDASSRQNPCARVVKSLIEETACEGRFRGLIRTPDVKYR